MFWTGAAAAATLTVGPGQGYATIQAAVNAATDGDVIEIHAGTYDEDVTVDKDLTLRGVGRPELRAATIAVFYSALTISTQVTLEGLRITGHGRRSYCVDLLGGGVRATSLTVVDTVFEQCRTAISVAGSDPLDVRRSVFRNNRDGVSGGQPLTVRSSAFLGNDTGVWADVDAVVTDNLFRGNGAGVQVYDLDDQVVARNLFCDNGPGGALALTVAYVSGNPVAEVRNNRFVENHGANGGAITGASGGYGTLGTVWLRGNTFVGNDGSRAAHVYLVDADAIVEDNLFVGGGAGGPAFATRGTGWYGAPPPTVTGDWNLFAGNAGGNYGASLSAGDFGPSTQWGVDPLFVDFLADGRCGDDLHLQAGSPAIDAGDPALVDPDGTRRDLGWIDHR